MARRKDAIFAMIDCQILHGQRFNRLSEADQGFYLKLWVFAVRERTALFPSSRYPARYLAHELHVPARRLARALSTLSLIELIDLLEDGSIFVRGVSEAHRRLSWAHEHLAELPTPEREP